MLMADGHFHSQHRDIKPANILVFRKEGAGFFDVEMKLTDFNTSSSIQKIKPNAAGVQADGGSRTYCTSG